MEFFLANELGNLDSACQKDFYSLLLCNLFPVSKELLHAVVVAILEEVFEAVLDTKLFISIGQDTNIDH